MRHFLFILLVLLFVGCETEDDNTVEPDIEVEAPTSKDKYYVQYSARYDSFHTHYIKYRDEKGDLISKTINCTSEEQKFEVGPVSSIFQAYIEGETCIYNYVSLNIYVRKNDQPYIRVATICPKSTTTSTLTYTLREYD